MTIDLERMSETELRDLRAQVDRALSTLNTRRLAEARRAAQEVASKHGFTLAQIVDGKGEKSAPASGGAAKYRNPADPAQTWSGRGRQPEWMRAALASGKSKSDFEI